MKKNIIQRESNQYDLKYLVKLHKENKKNPGKSKFLVDQKNFDRRLYDQLYTFDIDKELAPFTDPLEKKSKELENQNFLLKTQKRQKLARLNDRKIVKEKTEVERETNGPNFDSAIERVYKGRNKLKLNKIQNAKYEDKYVKEHVLRLVTGEDAISFFAKYGNTTPIKFIHCVKDPNCGFNPYKLVIVHDSNILTKVKHYYTVSPNGIVHIFSNSLINKRVKGLADRPTEFISLSDWMRESNQFNILVNIPFFRHYTASKVFKNWAENTKKRQFEATRGMILRDVFYCKPAFVESIFEIKSELSRLYEHRTVDFNQWLQKQVGFDEFNTFQKKKRGEVAELYSKRFEKILAIISALADKVKAVKLKNAAINAEHNFVNSLVKKKPLNLIKREKEEKGRRERLSQYDFSMLGRFVRFANYLALENLVSVNELSIAELSTELARERKNGLFTTMSTLTKAGVVFKVRKEDMLKAVHCIVDENVKLVRDLPKILGNSSFDEFLLPLCDTGYKTIIPDVADVIYRSTFHKRKINEISDRISHDFSECVKKVDNNYSYCKKIVVESEKFDAAAWVKGTPSLEEIKSKLNLLKDYKKDTTERIKDYFYGMLHVNSTQVSEMLNKFLDESMKTVKEYLYVFTMGVVNKTVAEFGTLHDSLAVEATDLANYAELIKNFRHVKDKLPTIKKEKDEIENMYKMLKQVNYVFTIQEESDYQNVLKLHEKIESNLCFVESNIEKQKEIFFGKFEELTDSCVERANETEELLGAPELSLVATPTNEALHKLSGIKEKLEKLKNRYDRIESYRETMGFPDLEKLTVFTDILDKYEEKYDLWSNCSRLTKDRENWFELNIKKLDTETVENELKSLNLFVAKSMAKNENEVNCAMANDLKSLNDLLPVVLALGNKKMTDTHWSEILKNFEGGATLLAKNNFNLTELLNIGVDKNMTLVEEVSGRATGEAEIQTDLDVIIKEWNKVQLKIVNYRSFKDKFILIELEEIFEKLEDSLMKIQGMMGSKYVAAIKHKVEVWENRLLLVQETLEEWIYLQKQWIYLENVFSADDIQRQLPSEYGKFHKIDEFWGDTMFKAFKKPGVFDNIANEEPLKLIKDSNKQLDNIQKMLEDYLDLKRRAFPRFYFLSNDDLLEIFSQLRNPQAVQPHLRKCFDNIKAVKFGSAEDGKENDILAMIGADPEQDPEVVHFTTPITAQGPVEDWLTAIEDMMRTTLFQKMKEFTKKTLSVDELMGNEHIFNYPAQVVLAVNMIITTMKSEKAIEGVQMTDLKLILDKKIEKLVGLISGELTVGQRELVKCLIVLDVHNRDVVDKLSRLPTLAVDDFKWQKELRYYWKKDKENKFDCFIEQTSFSTKYGYEYLGNSPRLVITPLTDKCYMTLTSALHLHYGGAPSGPAGTGKTETVKDLAKAIANICIVFNCSDSIVYETMARFLSGLAQCGAWACFDEFNRIDIEVLSVIAQQMQVIQNSVREQKEEFEFEGRFISLKPSFGVFITMNPGYAGRTELPDNLKALFRPVAMMIPNYGLIAEIILFSEGFKKANVLARKMAALYKLSSEQLSKQKHYDFGMRAVKSVLTMAGKLYRQDRNAEEESLLLKAMCDSNLPKFLKNDIPLFNGIINDLFPRLEVKDIINEQLIDAIKETMNKNNLQECDSFIDKTVQFYQTSNIRHGVMIVGETGTGKSAILETLVGSMAILKDTVHVYKLNPKSVTRGELFGWNDEYTNNFNHGIVSKLVTNALEIEGTEKRWFLFDGPVDADWIENLNTVLDDNKMLCLPDGKRLKLPNYISMVFEVENLSEASPATISRCGMIYLDSGSLDPFLVFSSWKNILFEELVDTQFDNVNKIIGKIKDEEFVNSTKEFLREMLGFVSRNRKECIGSVDINIITSTLNLLKIMILKFIEKITEKENNNKKKTRSKIDMLNAEECVNTFLAFSVAWGLSANQQVNTREAFNKAYFSKLKKNCGTYLMNVSSLYDFYFDFDDLECKDWNTKVKQYVYNPQTPFFNIMVNTVETVRTKSLLNLLTENKLSVFVNGSTGTGKTMVVTDFLSNLNSRFVSESVFFSAQTSAQNLADTFFERFTHKGKDLGPPSGKQMVFFVDDVNMPKIDEYGAQPVNELLRQVIDHNGFYDLKKYLFKRVKETSFVLACAPPNGGRNPLPSRLVRHFHLLHLPDLGATAMQVIFGSILTGYMSLNPQTGLLIDLTKKIVESSIKLYESISTELLPTPVKCHYTFNLRDLAKVVQGVIRTKHAFLNSSEDLVNLWVNETSRTFRDRLVNEDDKEWFDDKLTAIALSQMQRTIEPEENHKLIYTDLVDGEYKEIEHKKNLLDKIYKELTVYNSVKINKLNIILFDLALEHLCRVQRIISFPRGNAILVGLSGSGRKSLTQLATFLNKSDFFTFDISENYKITQWKDDLKEMLRSVVEPRADPPNGLVFMLTDDQMIHDVFLENINNLLNCGKVANLFTPEEMEDTINMAKKHAKLNKIAIENKSQASSYFFDKVRESLHVVLAFSPIGEGFREKCRQFPSIVNYSTLDWFEKWPQEAFFRIAEHQLQAQEGLDGQVAKLAGAMLEVNKAVEETAVTFFNQTGRKVYITPSNFLEFVATFGRLMAESRVRLPKQAEKYRLGLQKMSETKANIAVLKERIIAFQPQLVKAQEENEVIKADLEIKGAAASKKEELCEAEANEIGQTRTSVNKLRKECQKDLNQALPALYEAQRAAKGLDKNYISTIKTYNKVAKDIEMVLYAINLIFGKEESWPEVKKFLSDMEFHKKLTNLDPMTVPGRIWAKLRKEYLNRKEFDPVYLKEKVSEAISTFASYCINMEVYYKHKKEVDPKERKLKGAEEELEKVEEILRTKTDELNAAKNEVAQLQSKLNESIEKAKSIEKNQNTAKIHLQRAEKLITGLEDETKNWTVFSERLATDIENLFGDVLLASSYLAFIGPFSAEFRTILHNQWFSFIKNQNLLISENFSLIKVLSDDLTVREWQLNSLPSDKLSVENAILVTKTFRRPLMIDPQMQANKWIKNMERDQGLLVVKPTTGNLIKRIENAVRFGNPVLFENVEEKIDGALDPLLLRKFRTKGNQLLVKITDVEIPYNQDFRLFFTTKLANPHYLPEVTLKTNLINFTVTESGLEEQLLAEVVKIERPELEAEKDSLIKQLSNDDKQLKELQERILELIVNVQGNILDDEELIKTLEASKTTTAKINERMAKAEITNKRIDSIRDHYRPIAERGSLVYHAIARLPSIDPMYQFSLEYFVQFFVRAIGADDQSKDDVDKRASILKEKLTHLIFEDVCQGLFEKDKLLFLFMVTMKVALKGKSVMPKQWEFLKYGNRKDTEATFTQPDWFESEKVWRELNALEPLSMNFTSILEKFNEHEVEIKGVFSADSLRFESLGFLENYNQLTAIEKLLLLKVLRPEKLRELIIQFIEECMGAEVLDWPGFDLGRAFQQSNNRTPIILLLAPGADPVNNLKTLARQNNIDDSRFKFISLGQGQGEKAKETIKIAQLNGDWICLQNCHLVVNWLPELEVIQENVSEDCHNEYRLFLTSVPTDKFPVSFLQNSIKITNEPPKGVRANLRRIYNELDEEWYSTTERPVDFKNLLFCLSVFHSVLLERKKFGSIGWNIPYEWMNSDLETSQKHLKGYVEGTGPVPFDSLELMIGEINYGGRITDYNDQRLANSLLKRFINSQGLNTGSVLSDLEGRVEGLIVPQTDSLENVKDYIATLPLDDTPGLFGLHPNANIQLDIQKCREITNFVGLFEQSASGGGGASNADEFVLKLVNKFRSRLPPLLNIKPIDPSNSLLVFRNQEAHRFNALLKTIGESLADLEDCVKGLKVMSLEKEKMYDSFRKLEVPANWTKASFLSLKKLNEWFDELVNRVVFFSEWLEKDEVDVFWMGAFFFPQGFLTAVLQTFARKTGRAVDALALKTKVEGPVGGLAAEVFHVRVRGFYLENASFDEKAGVLEEPQPRKLFCELPIVDLIPVPLEECKYDGDVYECPMYKTSLRRGELSTTGHSTNFVTYLDLPVKEGSEDHWVRRSGAITLQKDD